MKDGFYLSTYLEISKAGNLYNYAHRHNHNLSLWKKKDNNVELIQYWELERVTGYKQHQVAFYDKEQAVAGINQLLKPRNLCIEDMSEIWGTPELSTCDDFHSLKEFPQYCYHNISHLFSGLLIDTDLFYKENILALAVDGASDQLIDKEATKKYAFSGCYSRKGKIKLLPISSPGPIWNMAREYFGLREGTLMALASAVQCDLKEYAFPSFQLHHTVNYDVFKFIQKLFTNTHILDLADKIDPMFTVEENRIAVIMKIIQNLSIELMERNVDLFIQEEGIDPRKSYLSITGGYGLNCPTNSYIMDKYQFKGFIAPPCIDDSGQSLGMALYAFYKKNGAFNFKLNHAYYGVEDKRPLSFLKNHYCDYIASVSPYDSNQVVADILEAPIVWFNGRAEMGPRALGNRSIIANPQSDTTKTALNHIKQRQWWRPVAPIILKEHINDWFEKAYPSSYMLHTFQILHEKARYVPAILHLDGSARVQAVTPESNDDLYNLLLDYYKKSGIPILCNTSLNDRNEPIINSIEEAINFALRKNMRILYFNRHRIELKNHASFGEKIPHQRSLCITPKDNIRQSLQEEINPYHVERNMILHCLQNNLLREYDLTNQRDVKCLQVIKRHMLNHEDFYKKIFNIKFCD